MNKFRECTIFRKDHNEHWRVLSIDTKLLPYINGHIDMVEYAALEQANAKIKHLETKLEIAVERLESLAADGYANQIDNEALEKLRGPNE